MERFSAAFLRANDDLVRQYIWSADPLHAWSRKYEYVWHAEAVRAALPPARAAAVAATWPDQAAAPAPQEAPFLVLDAGSGFTFFDQFLGSRLGVSVVALDSANYTLFFGGLMGALLQGEAEVPPIPFVQAPIERTGLLDASVDAITCVSVLEHLPVPNLLLTVAEFHRILKPRGRLFITFDTGQGPPAKGIKESGTLLAALRAQFAEDTSHGAPEAAAEAREDVSRLFHNRRANPPEYIELLFSVSAHVFVK